MDNRFQIVGKNVRPNYNEVSFDSELIKGKPAIFSKIDWLSFVFVDKSFNDVFEFLQIEDLIDVDEFFEEKYFQSYSFSDNLAFRFHGIFLAAMDVDKYSNLDVNTFFDVVYPRIKVDLSGQALDFLRGYYIDTLKNEPGYMEKRFTDPDIHLHFNSHITRIDYAFDFLNYMPTILDEMIEFIKSTQNEKGDYWVGFGKRGFSSKCSLKLFDQKTLYVGSPQSDKLLRVYDKKIQANKSTEVASLYETYERPDSWIRFELQLRNNFSHNFALTGRSSEQVLKYIYDNYNFHFKGTPCGFWQQLWRWEEIPSIIQNQSFVYAKPETPEEQFQKWIKRNIKYLIKFNLFQEKYKSFLNKNIKDIFLHLSEHSNMRRSFSIYSFLQQHGININDFIEDGEKLYLDEGIFQLK